MIEKGYSEIKQRIEPMFQSSKNKDVIIDIILNGENYTEGKWQSLYSDKTIKWRSDKLLQEVMVSTKGFPDDLCKKILSAAFSKNIFKAALTRNDMSVENIEIALNSLSIKDLNYLCLNDELSQTVINRIARKAIGQLNYDIDTKLDDYEIIAIGKTDANFVVQDFISHHSFDGINEKVLIAIINNEKLSDDVRNQTFDIGCDLTYICNYTKYIEDTIAQSYIDYADVYKGTSKERFVQSFCENISSVETAQKMIHEYGNTAIDASTVLYNKKLPHDIKLIGTLMNQICRYAKSDLKKVTSSSLVEFAKNTTGINYRLLGKENHVNFPVTIYDTVIVQDKSKNSSVSPIIELCNCLSLMDGTPDIYMEKLSKYRDDTNPHRLIDSAIIRLNTRFTKEAKNQGLNLPVYSFLFNKLGEDMKYDRPESIESYVLDFIKENKDVDSLKKFSNCLKETQRNVIDVINPSSKEEGSLCRSIDTIITKTIDIIEKNIQILELMPISAKESLNYDRNHILVQDYIESKDMSVTKETNVDNVLSDVTDVFTPKVVEEETKPTATTREIEIEEIF